MLLAIDVGNTDTKLGFFGRGERGKVGELEHTWRVTTSRRRTSDEYGVLFRALFSEAGQRDKIFPLAASQESFRRVQQVYQVFGAANMAEQKTYDMPHEFSGVDGIPFMARHLANGA